MSRCRIFFFVMLIVLVSAGALPCDAQQGLPSAADNQSGLAALPGTKNQKQPLDRYNDVALYIAGMKVEEKSGLYSLTKNPTWQHYASVTNDTWGSFTRTKIKK